MKRENNKLLVVSIIIIVILVGVIFFFANKTVKYTPDGSGCPEGQSEGPLGLCEDDCPEGQVRDELGFCVENPCQSDDQVPCGEGACYNPSEGESCCEIDPVFQVCGAEQYCDIISVPGGCRDN